jgi:small subunit ribosomal protein S3
VELKVTNFFQRSNVTRWQFVPNQFDWLQFQKKLAFQVLLNNKNVKTPSQSISQIQLLRSPKKIQKGLNFYWNHVESLTSQYFGSTSLWTPYKLENLSKSAEFMADFIAYLLESQKSTKQVFALAQKVLKKDKTVEGFKISCSGRLQGVEMAKTETKKFGKISLHVFSSKVDYAQSKASTPFGILGVKVWICYKD